MEKHKVNVGSILLWLNLIIAILYFLIFAAQNFSQFNTEGLLALFSSGYVLDSLVKDTKRLAEQIMLIIPYVSVIIAIKLKKPLGYLCASTVCFTWCYFIIHKGVTDLSASIGSKESIIELLTVFLIFAFITFVAYSILSFPLMLSGSLSSVEREYQCL